MGTSSDHRRWAEQCVAMARAAPKRKDKALWLTLAQSWARLADHAARAEHAEQNLEAGEATIAVPAAK